MKSRQVIEIQKAIMKAHPEMSKKPDSDFMKIMDVLLVIDPEVNADVKECLAYLNDLMTQAVKLGDQEQMAQIKIQMEKANKRLRNID